MQQKIADGMILVRATKEESAKIRPLRMMKFDKEGGFWYGEMSRALLEKLQEISGLIEPARLELAKLKGIQRMVDRERIKPDWEVKCYIDPPVKADLYTHQKRAMNMALITFGLTEAIQKGWENGRKEMALCEEGRQPNKGGSVLGNSDL